MSVPGLLIEYLINGTLAMIWIFPLIKDQTHFELNPFYLGMIGLSLYFIGMIIDYFAWLITRPIKKWIRKNIEKKYEIYPEKVAGLSHERKAKFALYSSEINKESNMRSSRDRIARGSIINAIFASIFVLPWFIGIGITLLCFRMWWGFEEISYGFELMAEKIIDEKRNK